MGAKSMWFLGDYVPVEQGNLGFAFVLACVALSERRIQMHGPARLLSLALVCAWAVIVARAQSPESLPKPGPEVEKLAVMVGRFANEGEVKAGAFGPNSPAMKVNGIDECSWTAGGFGLACTETVDIGGTKETETYLIYYSPFLKQYEEHGVRNTGEVEDQAGTVFGDTWTWTGAGTVAGKVFRTLYTMKFVSKDSYEYTDKWAEPAKSMELRMNGKRTRVAATKPAASNPGE